VKSYCNRERCLLAGRPVTEKAQNLLLESYENIGAVSSVMRLSGMLEILAFNEGGTTETNPFRPFLEDEKGFLCFNFFNEYLYLAPGALGSSHKLIASEDKKLISRRLVLSYAYHRKLDRLTLF
jgi:hypothetical protein